MQHILFIALQLGTLYWLSSRVHVHITRLFYGWFKSERCMVWAMSLLFWPGVLVHELAHLLMGRILLVKTGGLTIVPKIQSDTVVRMGSVSVPRTDRLRFFLIGVAPVIVGLGIIFGLLWAAEHYQVWNHWEAWLVVGYGIFQISNNMFLSSSDVKGALTLFTLIAIVVGLIYWMGWRPSVEWVATWLDGYEGILSQATRWLWVPILIDGFILALFGLATWLANGLKRKRYS